MGVCCKFVRHVWGWVSYHSGHRPKAMSVTAASIQLYPPARRRVKAEPVNNRKAP